MDPRRFDTLAKTLTRSGTRRHIVRLLTALPLGVTLTAVLGDLPDATAEDDDHGSSHRHHRRVARHRHRPGQHKDNPTRKRKRKDKSKRSDAELFTGRTCTPGTCGSQADGCGGTMRRGCGANQLCDGGTCRDRTVICPGGTCPGAVTLQPKLNVGGTVYACPGRYLGNFTTLQE